MTLGESRVRVSSNPSDLTLVTAIKQESAHFIDMCEKAKLAETEGETRRLWSLAQTAIEEAAMWAEKAATA